MSASDLDSKINEEKTEIKKHEEEISQKYKDIEKKKKI